MESLAPLGPIRVECRRNFIFQRGQNMLHFHCDVVAGPKWSQLRIVFQTNTFLGSDNIFAELDFCQMGVVVGSQIVIVSG